jgi:CubicO group peptidase (beta-lactamase class C family)
VVTDLLDEVDVLAREGDFHGVVRVDRGGELLLERAYGMADRRHGITMTPQHQLGIASGSKGFTALAVMSLVVDGVLDLGTAARSLLGDDLPLIDDTVSVEQLLTHRSGIGDYIDEEAGGEVTDYVLPVPVHRLDSTEAFVPILDGYPAAFAPGTRFAYCNGGFVVLALLAERASGTAYHDLVRRRVCRPAGMTATDFFRTDALPGRAAESYVHVDGQWRSNVLHLPVLANGDGGIYSTAADLTAFWSAMFDGRIVPTSVVAEMVRPRSHQPEHQSRYGLGVWLHEKSDVVWLEGYDAGVSFRSVHDPGSGLTHTVIGATDTGAWPLSRLLDAELGLA